MNDPAQPHPSEMKSARRLFYVLRLWQADAPQPTNWRASLESPETGQRIGFANLEQLFGYLMDRCERNGSCEDEG